MGPDDCKWKLAHDHEIRASLFPYRGISIGRYIHATTLHGVLPANEWIKTWPLDIFVRELHTEWRKQVLWIDRRGQLEDLMMQACYIISTKEEEKKNV